MSYILDALKKAESERERGAVPSLSTAQASHTAYIDASGSNKVLWWLLLPALLLVVVGGWFGHQSAAVHIAAPNVVQSSPGAPIASTAPASTASVPASNAAVSPRPVLAPPIQSPVPSRMVASVQAKPESVASPAATAVTDNAKVQAESKPTPATLAKTVPASDPAPALIAVPLTPPSSPARVVAGGVPMFAELPDSVRRQLPALNISGAVYSDAPPEWTLIINDQLMGKGSQVAPDLRLEEISASSAIFSFRGQRFRVER